ncbi:uncharacterized protein LOC144097538 [Amblyomma americanum]|uniref:J domain-containing protein n=1 Tax=Amblyomma americanum TaxID=6943 RepID=A0AAQ4F1G7_AMBAM
MAQRPDYYAILGLTRDATAADITKAYKTLALQWHPDKNVDNKKKAERMFRNISEAHSVLGNESSRQRYDERLRRASIPPSPSTTSRTYCYIVPSHPRQSSAQQSCSYTQAPVTAYPQSSVATYPNYSMTTVYSPPSAGRHPAYSYSMYQPSTSTQYPYTVPPSNYVPKPAMSMTTYIPTVSAPTPYYQTPSTTTNVSILRLPTDYERQTSTRIVQGNRMDLEVIKENAAEIVNVYENGVLTRSTYRRTGPPPYL